MKKEKKRQHIKEKEKRSSAEEIDVTEAYTDKPVQEQVSTMILHVSFSFFILLYSTVQENLTSSNLHEKLCMG